MGKKRDNSKLVIFIIFIISIVLVSFLVLSLSNDVVWIGNTLNYSSIEDTEFLHNFSANITGTGSNITFSISEGGGNNVEWNGAVVDYSDIFSWIFISNASIGNLSINVVNDSQTGKFSLPVKVAWTNTSESPPNNNYGSVVAFTFIVNATNDAPNFTIINNSYNLSENEDFIAYINASDEEEHYPLIFNITWEDTCIHASWSTRTNCSLFEAFNYSDISTLLNYTPTNNDVGVYSANISVMDFGNSTSYGCPHEYCDEATYNLNKTTYHSQLIEFNILSSLSINISNCTGLTLFEGSEFTCNINITTQGETDTINVSTLASIRNYDAGYISNLSWFHANSSETADNFSKTVLINITPQNTEVGNWSINFSTIDINSGEITSELIYLYVNQTTSSSPILDVTYLTNNQTSVNTNPVINISVQDNDFLIPDKVDSFNETLVFNVQVLNRSDLSQELSITGFDVDILHMPVVESNHLTNQTTAKIDFTPLIGDVGEYTINLSVSDNSTNLDLDMFNLTIVSNNYPDWNQTNYTFYLTVNSTLSTTESLEEIYGVINLSDTWTNDSDGNTLTFTNSTSAFQRFSLSTGGILNFTPYKEDVGYWNVNITADDGYLTNTTEFFFNISNVNSNPFIDNSTLLTNSNASASGLAIITQEDNYTQILISIYDEDFKITTAQKGVYNESLVPTTIIEGINSSLFEFELITLPTPSYPNKTIYQALFTPRKDDVGLYNVTLNITDNSSVVDSFVFNITIISLDHNPVLDSSINQTSAINQSLYYRINATDIEDGNTTINGGNTNFTFNYSMLSGTNLFNSTTFNSTTGEFNITFNDSQFGTYHINVTVNDSGGLEDSTDFWINVYGFPTINSPGIGYDFNLTENVTSNLKFTVNHSVQDNLTYLFYTNDILRYNLSYYGNNTNLTWQFTPNFTEETYGNLINLTLVVFPSNSDLENMSNFNITQSWSLNISHSNYPINFTSFIGSQSANSDQYIILNLTEYFLDIDYLDYIYNQTVNFTIVSNASPSYIAPYSLAYPNWTLAFTSPSAVSELITINAVDINLTNSSHNLTNVSSNQFRITFTTPSTTPVPTSGGGGGTIVKPVIIRIVFPDDIIITDNSWITVPFQIKNMGTYDLKEILLSSRVSYNNVEIEDIKTNMQVESIDLLKQGEYRNLSLFVKADTSRSGKYKITVYANVTSPKFEDWGDFYIDLRLSPETEAEKLLIFTEKLISENPECLELTELVREAESLFEEGFYTEASAKAEEAVDACEIAISKNIQRTYSREDIQENAYKVSIATVAILIAGMAIYFYKRVKFNKSKKDEYI